LCLPIDIQLELFQALVMPILLYGVEVWGFENLDKLERLHLKFLKIILNVKKCTTSNMVYGELGCFPISLYAKSRMVTYWGRLISGPQNKLSYIMYKTMYELDKTGNMEFKWLNSVRSTLQNCGLNQVWESQSFPCIKWLKSSVMQTCKDQFIQNWYSKVYESSKCTNYRIFKDNFSFEKYLIEVPQKYTTYMTKFRCRNSKLPVEIGCYAGIERVNRICTICMSNDIGDEFHYLFTCSALKKDRNTYIDKYYFLNPSSYKMHQLFNTTNKNTIIKLCKFISIIMKLLEN